MRGETAVENGVEFGEHGGETAPTASVGRRASIKTLQNMLRRASHDSSHHYNGGEWSAAAEMDSQPFVQNEDSADVIRTNPFHPHHKESTNKTNGASLQADVDPIFLLPSKFLESPQDLGYGIKKTKNGAKLSEHLNMSQKYDPKDELFRPSSLSPSVAANEDFQDASQTEKFSKLAQRNGSDVVADDLDGLFGSSNKGTGLVRLPQAVPSNPFHKPPASEADLFPSKDEELLRVKESREYTPTTDNDATGQSFKDKFDIFSSSSSTNAIDPFPSPLPRSLLNVSSLEDPFSPSPNKGYNHLQGGSRSTNGDEDIFATPSRTTFSSPSNDSPFASAEPIKKIPPKLPPKPPNKPRNLLTTLQGPKEDIVQPNPSSQTSSLSSSLSFSPADMNHVQTFKRPPRPVPRARRPKAEKPPTPDRPPPPVFSTEPEAEVPEQHVAETEAPKPPPKPVFKPLPKPVPPPKPKKPESTPLEPENYVVFEDVLLIGQEHCVEDWPEDSPELDPDFKPSGKFKLRRESMKAKMESDGGSSEDPDGTFGHVKKKDKKLRMSLLSRRSSKEKFSDDLMEGKNNTLPRRKSSKEFGSTGHISTGDDEEQYSYDYKKKTSKNTVNPLFRRASVASTTYEGKQMNGHLPQHSKDGDSDGKSSKRKNTIVRRKSEGSMLDERDYEEKKGSHRQRRNSKVKIKFVPQRGFAITLEKPHDEPKGAHGYTPRKDSKDKSFEDSGAYGYTPRDKLQEEDFEELNEMEGPDLHSAKAAIMEEEEEQRSQRYSPSLNGDDDVEATEARKHKKSKHKSLSRKSKASYRTKEEGSDNEMTEKDVKMPEEEVEDPDEIEMIKMKKHLKFKVPKKYKRKSKKAKKQSEAASDEHLSEAAKAAWEAAQMDEQAVAGAEEDEEDYDDEEQGDTDSLLEWWYTVEKWDEVPSDEEDAVLKEDESKSFAILAEKVERGLRLFNKVFTEQAEVLWEAIILLHALADDISEFHHKAKIAGISGGTTTAVGTVTAITGLALAPFTFGASLVVAAVGVGVATAGGITSASAAISDNVHNKNDRKKIEGVLQEYEDRLLEISNILHFVNQGLYRLRGHPFLRSGTQHYSQDWEVRKAVQMISIVDSPVMKATSITDDAVASLQHLFKGMDNYFVKETRELKKGCKKEIVGEIRKVANELNDYIVELNGIREELQEATGQV